MKTPFWHVIKVYICHNCMVVNAPQIPPTYPLFNCPFNPPERPFPGRKFPKFPRTRERGFGAASGSASNIVIFIYTKSLPCGPFRPLLASQLWYNNVKRAVGGQVSTNCSDNRLWLNGLQHTDRTMNQLFVLFRVYPGTQRE